jgi:multidrug transporter EmrE-like cation transporter
MRRTRLPGPNAHWPIEVTDGDATTTDGWWIPMAARDRILCDGVVQPVWESDGVPFSVGRAQHIVPDRTRRIVERRDRGCRVPGCTAGRFVEVHHIVHWRDGGATGTSNLVSVCPRHHKLHHQGRLGISGRTGSASAGSIPTHDANASTKPDGCPPATATRPDELSVHRGGTRPPLSCHPQRVDRGTDEALPYRPARRGQEGFVVAWLLLIVAGLFEVVWASLLPHTHGFSRPWPTLGFISALGVSMFLLAVAVRTLPVGTAYAVWVGIGAVGTVLVGVTLQHQNTNLPNLLALGGLVAAIAAVKLTAPH